MRLKPLEIVCDTVMIGLLAVGISGCGSTGAKEKSNFAGEYSDAHGSYYVIEGDGKGDCPDAHYRPNGLYRDEQPGRLVDCIGYTTSE